MHAVSAAGSRPVPMKAELRRRRGIVGWTGTVMRSLSLTPTHPPSLSRSLSPHLLLFSFYLPPSLPSPSFSSFLSDREEGRLKPFVHVHGTPEREDKDDPGYTEEGQVLCHVHHHPHKLQVR